MLRLNMLLASFVVLPASHLACQAGHYQDAKTSSTRYSRTAAPEPSPASLVLELDRAILVLKHGLKENWETRDQYLIAFEKTPSTDSAGRLVTEAKKYVECVILGAHLRTHQIWDEGPSLGVEVNRTLIEVTKLRDETEQAKIAKDGSSNPNGQAAGFRLPTCAVSTPRKVAVSAGVASGEC